MQRSIVLASLLAVTGCFALACCSPKKEATKESPIQPLPATLKMKQRSTAVVPGSGDKLTVTIDDITRDQVLVSMSEAGGKPVLGEVSLSEGKASNFEYAGSRFTLRLKSLDNALVGDDFANFAIEAAAGGVDEAARIEKLIAKVESLNDIVFVRNGEDHPPSHAAKLLRHKRDSLGTAITAEQFIEQAGTKSSTTGEPYQIRLADGKMVPSADFLRERLNELEGK